MSKEFIQELGGDVRKEAIDIYDYIDKKELRESYLAKIPQLGEAYRLLIRQSFNLDNNIIDRVCHIAPVAKNPTTMFIMLDLASFQIPILRITISKP
jgi:hypothetical protein